MQQKRNFSSSVQPSLFPCQGTGVNDAQNGSASAPAKFRNYIHTPEALWRLLATYPPTTTLVDALNSAAADFTRGTRSGFAPLLPEGRKKGGAA